MVMPMAGGRMAADNMAVMERTKRKEKKEGKEGGPLNWWKVGTIELRQCPCVCKSTVARLLVEGCERKRFKEAAVAECL